MTEEELGDLFDKSLDRILPRMYIQLEKNIDKGGWNDLKLIQLSDMMYRKALQLREAVFSGDEAMVRELSADLANYAMMLFNNSTQNGELDNG